MLYVIVDGICKLADTCPINLKIPTTKLQIQGRILYTPLKCRCLKFLMSMFDVCVIKDLRMCLDGHLESVASILYTNQ